MLDSSLKIFQFFIYSKIKEPWIPLLWKRIQNQRTISSTYFKKLKEQTIFMKEPAKNQWFSGRFFDFFLNVENCGRIPKLFLWNSWESMRKWVYTHVDNWWVCVPPMNHPTMSATHLTWHFQVFYLTTWSFLCGWLGLCILVEVCMFFTQPLDPWFNASIRIPSLISHC